MIHKDEFVKLVEDCESFEKVKLYVKEYISMLEESVEHNKSQLVSESDILLHLKENKSHREQLKDLMKVEAKYFKVYCKDIFSSWKYYQEFEGMCVWRRGYVVVINIGLRFYVVLRYKVSYL